ncbi:MAG: transcriptional regulator [Pseudomonadota bacterium]
MTLTELRYLISLDHERHFGRAAERCFVSQPTLSVAVRKLEDELGVTLFERNRNEVAPTPIGLRVLEQARVVLEEARLITQIAQDGKDPLRGPLRLGAIYTIGPYLLPRLIAPLAQRAPDMPLIIEENYTAVLTERLRQGALDVIILSLPYEHPALSTLPLYDEPFVVITPPQHPWRARATIRAEDLGGENVLLLGEGHCFRNQVLQACPRCVPDKPERRPQQDFEGASLETLRQMVASGLGVSVLPRTAALSFPALEGLLQVKPFAGSAPQRRVALAWRRSFPRPAAIDALQRAIRACELPGVTYLEQAAPPG